MKVLFGKLSKFKKNNNFLNSNGSCSLLQNIRGRRYTYNIKTKRIKGVLNLSLFLNNFFSKKPENIKKFAKIK